MVHLKSLTLAAFALASAATAAPQWAGAGAGAEVDAGVDAFGAAEIDVESGAGAGVGIWKRTWLGAGAGAGAEVEAGVDAGAGLFASADVEADAEAGVWKRGAHKGSKNCKATAKTAYSAASVKIGACTSKVKAILSGSASASAKVHACEKVVATAKASISGLEEIIVGLEGYNDIGVTVSEAALAHVVTVFVTDLNALYAALDAGASVSGWAAVTASFKAVAGARVHTCFSALGSLFAGISTLLSGLLGGLGLNAGLSVSVSAGLGISI